MDGRVLITVPLAEEPRRLVPMGTDKTGTVLDQRMKPKGGYIRLPCPVINYIGRQELFGSVEPRAYDYKSSSPKYWTKRVLVPWSDNFKVVADRPVLNMVLFRADNIVRTAQHVQEGKAGPTEMQISVNRYWDEIQSMLTGKSGILTRDVFGVRAKHSLRCVMVPDPDLSPTEIGLPRSAAHAAGIDEDDWVLAVRSPVLWQGSVLAMRAKLVDGLCGQAPIYVMQGLGLDFDGDQMAFYRCPVELNPEISEPLRSSAGKHTHEHFVWQGEFLVLNPEETPNWDIIGIDRDIRLNVTGMSLGPEDILDPDNSEYFGAVARHNDIPPEIKAFAEGLTSTEWAKYAEKAAMQVTKLKMEIGLLGAATDKLNQLLLAFDPSLLPAGMAFKERLTDMMMKAAKKPLSTGYSTDKITRLLDKRGEFSEASSETAAEYIEQIGFDKQVYLPVIKLVYDLGGVTSATQSYMPLLTLCRKNDREAVVRLLNGEWGYGSIAARIHEYTEGASNEGLIPLQRIRTAGIQEQPVRRLRGTDVRRGKTRNKTQPKAKAS